MFYLGLLLFLTPFIALPVVALRFGGLKALALAFVIASAIAALIWAGATLMIQG